MINHIAERGSLVYEVHLEQSGGMLYHLCTADTAIGAGAIVQSLCAAASPHYVRIEVRLVPSHLAEGHHGT